jgi:NADPH2:quinone reductase
MFGWSGPKRTILGTEVAGEIEAVGKDVSLFKKGDRVFGISSLTLGAYAEYVCRSEKGALAVMPPNVTFEEAAALPAGAGTALYFLRDLARIRAGQSILIIGASGGVGTYAVQLARYFGAEITGVCSTRNVEMVKSLGAGKVIDYTREDIAGRGERFDVIMDTVVGRTSFARYRGLLTERGMYLAVAAGVKEFGQMLRTSIMRGKRILAGTPVERREELVFLGGLVESGEIRPVIDRRYPLEQAAEAHRHVDGGHKRGNVVITVDHPET